MNKAPTNDLARSAGTTLSHSTLVQLLRWRALHQGDQVAYTFLIDGEGQEVRTTYGELDCKARAIAATLLSIVKRGQRVLLLYPPGLDFIAAFFGCFYAGVVAIPAYPPDPARLNRSLPRLQSIIMDAQVTTTLTTSEILAMAKLLFAHAPDLERMQWLATDNLAAGLEARWQEQSVNALEIAFLQYTSGSTGTPKGVMLSHQNLLHNASLVHHGLGHTPSDSYVSWLPIFHDMGFMAGILQPLYAGIPVILMSPISFLQSPIRWLRAMSKYRATTTGGPNFAYDLCVRSITPEQRESLDLRHWTAAFNGAEPIRAETMERFAKAFAAFGFRREAFYPCYGLAEATLIVSGGGKVRPPVVQSFGSDALEQRRSVLVSADDEQARTLVSCGQVLLDQQIVIVDPESMTRCAPDEIGEIWLSGPSIAQGYWNQRDETERIFHARLKDTGEGPFLRTGDIGFLCDGELYIAGRLKDLIIIRGRNLYPQDIELTAERCHKAVRPGCGAAFSVDVSGEERLVLVQEVKVNPQPDLEEVFQAIRQAVAAEHQVQIHAIVLIEPKSIPKTSSGKIQRRSCRTGFQKGSLPVVGQWVSSAVAVQPLAVSTTDAPVWDASAVEGWLAKNLAAKLGVDLGTIDINQPIARYGLDSLVAIELMHGLETNLGVRLPMVSFFENTSIAEVAALSQSKESSQPLCLPLAAAPEKSSEFPLSYGQKALWFLHQLAPQSAAYNVFFATRIQGDLDVSALRQTFQDMVERHPSLRTTFKASPLGPVQRIQEHLDVHFHVETSEAGAASLHERLVVESQRPFDLEQGPLLRINLFTQGERDHVLLLVFHHIISDLWSLAVLMSEMGALYSARTAGTDIALPAPALQYTDYARWQMQMLAGPEGARLSAYWQKQLTGELPVLNLPTDRPRPAVQTYRGASHPFKLGAELSGKVLDLGRAENATLYMTLLAAFQVLLSHYTGQDELLVGSPTAGRKWAELAEQVGYFVNPVVLRSRCTHDLTFREFLRQVRGTVLEAFEHQDYPFARLVEQLQPERELSRSPLFQVMFILQRNHLLNEEGASAFALGEAGARMKLGDLTLESMALEQRVAQFDLTLIAAEVGGCLATSWQYNTDLFDAETIARMAGSFETLLEAIVTQPEQSLASFSLLTAAERREMLLEWNETRAEYADLTTLHQTFEAQVKRSPNATALEFERERVTYRELNLRANQLAWQLRAQGVGPEVRVGVCLERSVEMIVGLLGVLKAGGAYVPLDPTYPKERVAFMLADAQPHVLLTRERLVQELSLRAMHVLCLDTDSDVIARNEGTNPPCLTTPDNAAYVIYTSGSTGNPKGVVGLHRGALNRFNWMWQAYPFAPGEACCQKTSLNFVDSVWEIFGPLLGGARLVIVPDEAAQDPRHLAQILAARNVTRIVVVPSLLRAMLDAGTDMQGHLSGLKYWTTSGEMMPADLCSSFQQKFPQSTLINLYGSSEVSADATCYEVPAQAELQTVFIGQPIANSRAYLLNSAFQPVPAGVPGALYIGGSGLARGYFNRPDQTALRFVPDPFSGEPGARLYQTGDLARYRTNGDLEFLGRSDYQVKLRGYRIELGEIEAVLVQHESVLECVVVAREDVPGEQRLVGYLVTDRERPATVPELRRYLRERLPEYMIPAALLILEALPLTPNGKINRQALPAPYTVEMSSAKTAAAGAPTPQTELERMLVSIWREVLSRESLTVADNFFDLGGHSLLLVQVQSRLRERMGLNLPIAELFKYPSISSLASYLSQGAKVAASASATSRARSKRRRSQRREQDASAERTGQEIAVVGMAGRFPSAANLDEYWRNLSHGVESITFFTDHELASFGVPASFLKDSRFVKAGALLEGQDLFDAAFFGYSPREAELMDPQQRLFLECAWQALENAGYDAENQEGSIGVYAGIGLSTYLLFNLLPHTELINSEDGFQVMLGSDKDFLSTRVSYKLNLKGPSVSIQTACSTSLVAIYQACESLQAERCEMALAGGVSITVPQRMGYFYQAGGILSPDGHCRAFDAAAQGTLFGSGAGIVVLKRLADALADGDTIHAVIKGAAINNDGSLKVGYTAPSVEGQAQVIAEALAHAGVEPETITYLEAHGTGTPLGDPIEVAALTEAFGKSEGQKGFCAIGSVKTNIGHLDTAAGVAGLIKTILALKHRQIPPSLHFQNPNPKIDFSNSPFFVNTTLSPWLSHSAPRRAGVSSFGIGGTNAHIILEESPASVPSGLSRPWQLLMLSAKSAPALQAASDNLLHFLRSYPEVKLADIAYTLHLGRRHFNHQRLLLARDHDDAIQLLEGGEPSRLLTHYQPPQQRPIVFMFSGQGTQHVNMGRQLYESEPLFRHHLDYCAELLTAELGLDLRAVLYPAEAERAESARQLAQTCLAQPALFAIEYALAKLWMQWGVQPAAMIGHSLGEYVAACLAGVFTLEEGLHLVARRGRLMQQMPAGAMLAVALPEAEVRLLLSEALSLAAVNGPRLCVVSGENEVVEKLAARLTGMGTESQRLQTSHAFHSQMMEPMLEEYIAQVRQVRLRPPQIPYISNVSGSWITEAEATDASYYARQLRETVRFCEGIGELMTERERILLEVGPGQTLCQLARQQGERAVEHVALSSMGHVREGEPEEMHLLMTLGRMWLARAEVSWKGFYEGERRQRVELPTYPFERQSYWIDPQPFKVNQLAAETGKRANITDWFYVPAWKQSVTLRQASPLEFAAGQSPWLLFLDSCGLGTQLAEWLREARHPVITIEIGQRFEKTGPLSYKINPRSQEDYERLCRVLRASNQTPGRVVHLWSLTAERGSAQGCDLFPETQERGFYSLMFLMQAMGEPTAAHPLALWVITNRLQAIESGDASQPEKATILGACKVIPQEYEHTICRCIDVVAPVPASGEAATLLNQLKAEINAVSAEPLVAYRGRQRWAQQVEPWPLDRHSASLRVLREKGVYLITGGMGRVGLLLAEYLARTVQARLVLTGRTFFPSREEWDQWLSTHHLEDEVSRKIRKVQALENRGAEVFIASADVADEGQMQSVIAATDQRFGALHGVIHAAGMVGEKDMSLVRETSRGQCESHFHGKVHGAYVLARLLQNRPLDFCLLLSSNTSVLGGLGAIGYAAANQFLDSFALARSRHDGSPWISANWDGWLVDEEEHLSASLHTSVDRYAMTPQESVEAFQRVVSFAPTGQVIVSTGDLPSRLKTWIGRKSQSETPDADFPDAASKMLHPRPVMGIAYVAPTTELEHIIAGVWEDLLGIELVGIHDNFFDLGGNSLIGLKMITRLKAELHIEIPTVRLFEGPTINALAQVISQERIIGKTSEKSRSRGQKRREKALLPSPSGD